MSIEVFAITDKNLIICRTQFGEAKYSIDQINGQRVAKLMDTHTEPEPRAEVYAFNIPRNIPMEELFIFFLQCGEIYQIRLLMDFSGYNRGRCFIQYKTVRASREAICLLNQEVISGTHMVTVKMSLNNDQLVLKSIPAWITEQNLKEILHNFIGDGLVEVVVRPSKLPYKNICFCKYRNHYHAVMAHKKAWPYINVIGAVIDVHWALPQLTRHATNLFFTNFPSDLTKAEFFTILVKKIDIKTLVQFRIAKNSGLITFFNFTAMKKGHRALEHLMIRRFKLRFSRMPFSDEGLDRLGSEYFENRNIPMPLSENPNLMPCLPVRFSSVPPNLEPPCVMNYPMQVPPPVMPPYVFSDRHFQQTYTIESSTTGTTSSAVSYY